MVYDNFLDRYTIVEKELYEPRIFHKLRVRYLCYLIALLFISEDVLKLYLTKINYYGRQDPYYTHVECPMELSLRVVTILSCFCLIYGIKKPKSTPIAVFLWTQFEVNTIFVTFFCYKAIMDMLQKSENYQDIGILIAKAGLWWIVNLFHNYQKEKEYAETGGVRMSRAFTKIVRYHLPGQKTSI